MAGDSALLLENLPVRLWRQEQDALRAEIWHRREDELFSTILLKYKCLMDWGWGHRDVKKSDIGRVFFIAFLWTKTEKWKLRQCNMGRSATKPDFQRITALNIFDTLFRLVRHRKRHGKSSRVIKLRANGRSCWESLLLANNVASVYTGLPLPCRIMSCSFHTYELFK